VTISATNGRVLSTAKTRSRLEVDGLYVITVYTRMGILGGAKTKTVQVIQALYDGFDRHVYDTAPCVPVHGLEMSTGGLPQNLGACAAACVSPLKTPRQSCRRQANAAEATPIDGSQSRQAAPLGTAREESERAQAEPHLWGGPAEKRGFVLQPPRFDLFPGSSSFPTVLGHFVLSTRVSVLR